MLEREIKFRGKRIDNNEWVYGYYHRKEFIDGDFINNNEIDSKTLGQYTGEKDIDNKEIYEGDIVICKGDTYEYKYEVLFVDSAFKLVGILDPLQASLVNLEEKIKQVKVVRNIKAIT